MLEMCGQTAVPGHGCPIIGQDLNIWTAGRHHGFDGQHHAGQERYPGGFPRLEIRNFGLFVKFSPDAVTNEASYNTKAMA